MADDQGADQTVEVEGEDNEAIEAEAKAMGWNPNHTGDKFIPAKEFVERGKSILPIVQATNERLRAEIAARDAKHADEIKALRAGQAALEEAHEADLTEARKAERASVTADLAAASEAGDHAGVATATSKLADLSAEEREAAAAAAAKKANGSGDGSDRAVPKIPVEVKEWLKANPTFAKDPVKIAVGNVIGSEMRAAGTELTGAAFLDEVANRVEKRLGGGARSDKLESGGARGGAGTGGGSGKTYNDLPSEAKAACERFANKMVGPGRAHKDMASFQKSYAAKYFQQG